MLPDSFGRKRHSLHSPKAFDEDLKINRLSYINLTQNTQDVRQVLILHTIALTCDIALINTLLRLVFIKAILSAEESVGMEEYIALEGGQRSSSYDTAIVLA